MRPGTIAILVAAVALLVGACGSGSGGSSSAGGATGPGTVSTAAHTTGAGSGESFSTGVPAAAATKGAPLTDWPEFGLNPQRSDATNRPTGITAKNVGELVDRQVKLPGTIDSSPLYLHAAEVGAVPTTW